MNMSWRKSSFSSTNGGNCVEVGTWRTSSYSTTNGGACVEVGTRRKPSHGTSNGGECVEDATISATVAVRDTKDNDHGPVLRFTPRAWQSFTTTLK